MKGPRARLESLCDVCGQRLRLQPLLAHGVGTAVASCDGCGSLSLVEQRQLVLLEEAPWVAFVRRSNGVFAWWHVTGERCGNCLGPTLLEARIKRIGLAPAAIPKVCLLCGVVAVQPSRKDPELPGLLLGGKWEPPDAAVKALRALIYDIEGRENDDES